MQIAKRVFANARDLIGVEQQQLQRLQTTEYISRQIFDFVAIQNAAKKNIQSIVLDMKTPRFSVITYNNNLQSCQRFEAAERIMSHPTNVVVRQIDAAQSLKGRERFGRQLGDEILLQTTARQNTQKRTKTINRHHQ